jgi:hypothetical protein
MNAHTLEQLETKIAFLERANVELSDVLFRQRPCGNAPFGVRETVGSWPRISSWMVLRVRSRGSRELA